MQALFSKFLNFFNLAGIRHPSAGTRPQKGVSVKGLHREKKGSGQALPCQAYSFTWWQVGQVFPPGGSWVPQRWQNCGAFGAVSSEGESWFSFSSRRWEESTCWASSLMISESPSSTPQAMPARKAHQSSAMGPPPEKAKKIPHSTPKASTAHPNTRRPKDMSFHRNSSSPLLSV